MKKLLILILSITLAVSSSMNLSAVDNVYSSSGGEFLKVGAAGAQFLKIGAGARANSMGTAGTSTLNDLTCLTWNPAGIADVNTMQGHFSYTQWFADYSHSFAAVSAPISEDFTAAFHLISFGTSNVEITTLVNPEGTGTSYNINDVVLGASFGGRLTDQFTFGITAKYVTQAFADLNSSGFAFDIGTLYKTGIQGITLGFSIMNLGTQMGYSGQDLNLTAKRVVELSGSPMDAQFLTSDYSMPLIFRAGLSSDVYKDDIHKVVAAVDFVTYSDVPEQFGVGFEWTWKELLSVRGGYLMGHDQMGLSGGIGINYLIGDMRGIIDYSINPTKDLGIINRLSISIGME